MKPLDKFGKFLIQNLRDKALDYHALVQKGHWNDEETKMVQKAITALDTKTKKLISDCVADALATGMHDFLFALQEAHDNEEGIGVVVDRTDVAEVSDGLNGELYGDNGWI